MRRYDDPVEVRKGWVTGVEAPEQFLWRGRLWKVRAVLAHWVETGPWWQSAGVRAVLGSEESDGSDAQDPGPRPLGDLLTERELWRVEAGRGAVPVAIVGPDGPDGLDGGGVFDLAFDWADGRWQLVGCAD
jgi:hypothetical protein